MVWYRQHILGRKQIFLWTFPCQSDYLFVALFISLFEKGTIFWKLLDLPKYPFMWMGEKFLHIYITVYGEQGFTAGGLPCRSTDSGIGHFENGEIILFTLPKSCTEKKGSAPLIHCTSLLCASIYGGMYVLHMYRSVQRKLSRFWNSWNLFPFLKVADDWVVSGQLSDKVD
jgi:hypothetical protein